METTGQDNAYEHDMRVEYARGAADALWAVRDYYNHLSNVMAQDPAVTAIALAISSVTTVIGNEFGVQL